MNRFFFLILLWYPVVGYSQFSDSTRVSVITCGPSQDELYTAFGHSAFRVNDPQSGYDAVYNYGVFDFRQKHFYLNFARGYLYYKLGVHDFRDFEYHYIADNRFVHEQILNLSNDQRNKLVSYLIWNSKPENQFYRYDYFYDNCATKIRDVVEIALGDSVSFDGSYIKTDYTIRELTDLYLPLQPWGDLGIDICLGLPMDKKASPREYMFLPDYIEAGFNHATVLNESGRQPLVQRTIRRFDATGDHGAANFFIHPLTVFSVLFLVAAFLSYRDWKRNSLTHVFDSFLFTITGAIGLLLLLLWIATDHRAAAKNFNLLWALPTNLIAGIALIRRSRWLKTYFVVVALISGCTLVAWIWLPQKLHYALIPLVLTLCVRSFTQYKLRSKYM